MMERSSWSRHGRILEVSDVSKNEALEYLELRKIYKENAVGIYELVGGRMVDLDFAASEVKSNRKLLGMYERSMSKAVLITLQI